MNRPRRKAGESIDDYVKRASVILHSNGYHFSEIAKKLKVDKLTVYNILVHSPRCRITTEDERAIMIELRGRGYSYRKIAEEVGRSATCVRERINSPAKFYDGYPESVLTDQQIDQMKKWYAEGKTIKFIADQFGIHRSCILYRLKSAGLFDPSRTPAKVSTNEKYGYYKMHKKGKTNVEIAKHYGRNDSTVSRHLKQFKQD